MRIIISPAKKMKTDTDSLPHESLPYFLSEAEQILGRLRELDYPALKALWRCNDTIAEENFARIQAMELRQNLSPALLSYEGIQYQYMAPGVFSREELAYIGEHLRILSGLYGVLRPFDGVSPYRLEMQAKLALSGAQNLYTFWGDKPAAALAKESDLIVNLASKEYSKSVLPHLPKGVRVISCSFGEEKNGKLMEKGTLCKMARGEMLRFMAEQQISDPKELKAFERLGYTYSKELSRTDHYVFVKAADRKPPQFDF